jgi:hypothetical protein
MNKAITRPVGKMSNKEVDAYLGRKDREAMSTPDNAVPEVTDEEKKVRALDEKRAIKFEQQGKSMDDRTAEYVQKCYSHVLSGETEEDLKRKKKQPEKADGHTLGTDPALRDEGEMVPKKEPDAYKSKTPHAKVPSKFFDKPEAERNRIVGERAWKEYDKKHEKKEKSLMSVIDNLLEKAVLTTEAREKIPKKDFALPGGRYPIEDKIHARNALSRVSQHGTPEEKAKVRAKVHKKYPDIGDHEDEKKSISALCDEIMEKAQSRSAMGQYDEHVVRALKKKKGVENPFALATWIKEHKKSVETDEDLDKAIMEFDLAKKYSDFDDEGGSKPSRFAINRAAKQEREWETGERDKKEPPRAAKYAESNVSDTTDETDESLDANFEKYGRPNKSMIVNTVDELIEKARVAASKVRSVKLSPEHEKEVVERHEKKLKALKQSSYKPDYSRYAERMYKEEGGEKSLNERTIDLVKSGYFLTKDQESRKKIADAVRAVRLHREGMHEEAHKIKPDPKKLATAAWKHNAMIAASQREKSILATWAKDSAFVTKGHVMGPGGEEATLVKRSSMYDKPLVQAEHGKRTPTYHQIEQKMDQRGSASREMKAKKKIKDLGLDEGAE